MRNGRDLGKGWRDWRKRGAGVISTVVALGRDAELFTEARAVCVVEEGLKDGGGRCTGFVALLGGEFVGSEVWVVL